MLTGWYPTGRARVGDTAHPPDLLHDEQSCSELLPAPLLLQSTVLHRCGRGPVRAGQLQLLYSQPSRQICYGECSRRPVFVAISSLFVFKNIPPVCNARCQNLVEKTDTQTFSRHNLRARPRQLLIQHTFHELSLYLCLTNGYT